MERLHRLLDRGLRDEPVNLVEVDVVGAQPSQRGVDLFHDRLARQTGPTRAVVDREEHPCGHHDVVAVGEFFRARPTASSEVRVVAVGGVPEVDPEVQGLPEERPVWGHRASRSVGSPTTEFFNISLFLAVDQVVLVSPKLRQPTVRRRIR